MDAKVLTAVIGAASAILGAGVGAFAKGYTSRQKLREMEFEYEKRLQAGYLEKAREYLKSVYIPLSIAVSNLNGAFLSFRADSSTQAAHLRLKKAIRNFLSIIEDMGKKGANAFLTTDLDETLHAFCNFLHGSLVAKESKVKAILKISFRSWPLIPTLKSEEEYILRGKKTKYLRSGSIGFKLGGFGFAYKADEVLSAPIDAPDFEVRFIRDIHTINVFVKEVTLGAKAREGS